MESTDILIGLGRILLGGAFVFAGVRNLTNVPFLSGLMAARGVPFARLALYLGIALQIAAGLLFAAGVAVPHAAAALVVFLAVATPIFHNFWDHQGIDRANRINGFVANIALAGGFLVAMAGAN